MRVSHVLFVSIFSEIHPSSISSGVTVTDNTPDRIRASHVPEAIGVLAYNVMVIHCGG